MGLQYVTVPLSGTVTGDVDLRKEMLLAVGLPVVTSGNLYVQGNYDTTSALFRRLNDDLGDFQLNTAAGSKWVSWPQGFPTLSYARFETQNSQTAIRTLEILTGPRR